MWFNAFISRGFIPDFLLRRGVRSQGKQRLQMMKNSDLEKLRLELEATKSELEATKTIIIAKNTDLKILEEKVEFLLEAKKSNKIVNKLPEELDKNIVK